MRTSPFKYTSRDYESLMADVNADSELVNTPEWWKRLLCGIGDYASMINNAQGNNNYLPTAFSRRAVMDLCYLIGYTLTEQLPSSGSLYFTLMSSATFPITLASTDLIASTKGTLSASMIRFEGRAALTISSQTQDAVNLTSSPISGNIITTGASYVLGEKIQIASAGGTIPTGLSAGTDYYAIPYGTTGLKFASSYSNAINGTYITISGGSGACTINRYSYPATVYSQTTKSSYVIGTSDGSSEWQEFDLSDLYVLKDTISVVINNVAWTRTTNFVLAEATNVYKLIYRSDGSSYIQFGNGTYGNIPGNYEINVTYAVGGGSGSNVGAQTVVLYAGTNSNIQSVFNATAFTGGSDAETIATAKNVAPDSITAADRFILAADGEALALSYGGVSLAKCTPNVRGVLSCDMCFVATGGGNPTSAILAALQTYLISKTCFGAVDVQCKSGTFTPEDITAVITMKTGYVFANWLPYITLAIVLFFSDRGAEILDAYDSSGVSSATTIINTLINETTSGSYGFDFTASDYTVITAILDQLANYGARNFGDTIQYDSFVGYLQSCALGISHISMTSPAESSFPLIYSETQIAQSGTISLTAGS